MAAMTTEQKRLVKSTAPILQTEGERITKHFYKRMLDNNDKLKNIFNLAHQETGAQPRALAHAVFAYAANIDNLEVLGKAVSLIAHKHASLLIAPEHYPIVGENLLASIKECLGDAVDDTLLDAWSAAYTQLADILIGVEKNLYDSAASLEGGWRGWRKFNVAKKEKESNNITSFYLEPVDGKPVSIYKPGQFISIKQFVKEIGYDQPRQYSLSTTSNSKYIRISIKQETEINGKPAGKVSSLMHLHIQEGQQVDVSPPFGDFHLDEEAETPVVLVSAGVGITPMLAMLESLSSPKDVGAEKVEPRKVVFVHGAHSKSDHPMKEHVQQIVDKNTNSVSRCIFYSDVSGATQGADYDHSGRVDLNKVRKEVVLEGADYYVCGPHSFMTDMTAQLISFGVNENKIHSEIFGVMLQH